MSVILWGGLAWILHFILEFLVIIKTDSPLIFISFHFIGIIVGGIFALKVVSKWNHFVGYLGFIGVQVFWYIFLGMVTKAWLVPIGLFGAGFSIGVVFGLYKEQFVFIMEDPKFGGRMYALGLLGGSPFVIILALIGIDVFWTSTMYYIAIFILILTITIIGRTEHKIPPQEPLDVGKYLKKKENLPKVTLGFFFGFFITNAYYATFLIIREAYKELSVLDLQAKFSTFVIILWLTVGLFGIINGLIMDLIGRRIVILIGLCIQSLAFLMLAFLSQTELLLLYIFPICLGIGFMMTINGCLCFFIEEPPPQYVRDTNFIYFTFAGIGMLGGVLIGELMSSVVLTNPAYLTVVLLFTFVIATVVINQIKETLPSKEELEWKDSIRDFFCIITESGVCVYRHTFTEEIPINENLFAGGISGICMLCQEMIKSEEPTQVIDQGDVKLLFETTKNVTCILLGKENLKILREKLKDITAEIEQLFKSVFPTWEGNLDIFVPIGSLVEKHFSE
ncbi:MAG: MFS transporter [Candidatus Helarchaeota archaeon]|nr:MFS transporter [Candidatus Helarchaeota archaeon]